MRIVTPEGNEMIPAVEISPLDPTGAGDCFNAALAVGLGEGLTLADAVHQANYAGAFMTTHLGVIDGLPNAQPTRRIHGFQAEECGERYRSTKGHEETRTNSERGYFSFFLRAPLCAFVDSNFCFGPTRRTKNMAVEFGFTLPIGPPKNQLDRFLTDLDETLPALEGHFNSLWMTDHFFWDDEPTYEAWTVLAYIAALWPQFKDLAHGAGVVIAIPLPYAYCVLTYSAAGPPMAVGAGRK